MQALPFVPKQHKEIPDSYGIKIRFMDGKTEEFEIALHSIHKELGVFEFVTKDDVWSLIPVTSIVRIEFDKNYSKLIEIRRSVSEKVGKTTNE